MSDSSTQINPPGNLTSYIPISLSMWTFEIVPSYPLHLTLSSILNLGIRLSLSSARKNSTSDINLLHVLIEGLSKRLISNFAHSINSVGQDKFEFNEFITKPRNPNQQ